MIYSIIFSLISILPAQNSRPTQDFQANPGARPRIPADTQKDQEQGSNKIVNKCHRKIKRLRREILDCAGHGAKARELRHLSGALESEMDEIKRSVDFYSRDRERGHPFEDRLRRLIKTAIKMDPLVARYDELEEIWEETRECLDELAEAYRLPDIPWGSGRR